MAGEESEQEGQGAFPLLDLDQNVIQQVMLCISDPRDILACSLACKALKEHAYQDVVWRPLCAQRWSGKPRFELTDTRSQQLLSASFQSWRGEYARVEAAEAGRVNITEREVCSNTWYFNFLGEGGMRAQAKPVTSRRTLGDFPFLHAVRFTSDGVLHMGKGFPPKLPWILVCSTCERRPVSVVGHNDEPFFLLDASWSMHTAECPHAKDEGGGSCPVSLAVANFPLHAVRRDEERWEWITQNSHVVLWTMPLERGAPLSYVYGTLAWPGDNLWGEGSGSDTESEEWNGVEDDNEERRI